MAEVVGYMLIKLLECFSSFSPLASTGCTAGHTHFFPEWGGRIELAVCLYGQHGLVFSYKGAKLLL